jgi:hypothetical protein
MNGYAMAITDKENTGPAVTANCTRRSLTEPIADMAALMEDAVQNHLATGVIAMTTAMAMAATTMIVTEVIVTTIIAMAMVVTIITIAMIMIMQMEDAEIITMTVKV